MGDRFLHRLAEALGPGLIRVLGSTFDVIHLPKGIEAERRRRGERVIYAFWHGRMLIPAYTHRFRKVGILISRHGDGEFIARVVRRLGFLPARGSSTRGGVAGLKAILDLAAKGHDLAFTPDGPRGPRYSVQPGVVYAASRTGLPIVPGALEALPAFTLGSWDEFTIPMPFARVMIIEGDPIHVPPDLDDEAIRRCCRVVEATMRDLMTRARRLLRETARRARG